ncbi:MAG: nuclear transport factor 2 family protein [Methanobacteriota archaeon]
MSMEQGTEKTPERLVRQYFEGLRRFRVVDALDVFATDAVLRDEKGAVHRGIREIARSFVRARRPRRVHVIELSQEEGRVTAIVQDRGTAAGKETRHREVFHVDGGRVRSLTVTQFSSNREERPTAAGRKFAAGA